MILVASKYLVPKGYAAMAVYPFILVCDEKLKKNKVLMNHEKIHLRQQAELLVIPFYVWYVAEYFIRLALYRDRKKAYRTLSFEQEAYTNESDSNYLYNRPVWGFMKFIKR